jgi:hypothetical protein
MNRQPRDLPKNAQSDSLKKSQPTLLSQEMLKKGDDDSDGVDDEVRTTVPSQNLATATLST